MRRFFNSLGFRLNKLQLPFSRRALSPSIRTTLKPLTARLAGTALNFCLTWYLANAWGPQYVGGLYTYIIFSLFLGSIISLGLGTRLLQQIALHPDSQWLLTTSAYRYVLPRAILIVFLAAMALNATSSLASLSRFSVHIVPGVLATSFINGFFRLSLDTLRGLGKHSLAFTLEFSISPAVVLLAAVTTHYINGFNSINVLFLSYTITQGVLFLITTAFLASAKYTPVLENGNRPHYEWHFNSYKYYWAVLVCNNLLPFTPYALLEYFVPLRELGIFSVAHRLIGVVATGMAAVGQIYAPRLARTSQSGLSWKLEEPKVYQKAQLTIFVLSGLLLSPYLFLPKTVLGFFGTPFVTPVAVTILLIFASFRLVQACFGAPEIALLMSDNAHRELISVAVAVIIGAISGIATMQYGPLIAVSIGISTVHLTRSAFSWLLLPPVFANHSQV